MFSPSPPYVVIPDIFIPPTQHGNAGGRRGRDENSGMTREEAGGGFCAMPLRGWIVPVGGSTPDRLKLTRLKDRLKIRDLERRKRG